MKSNKTIIGVGIGFVVIVIFVILQLWALNINRLDVKINNADCISEKNIKAESLITKNILFFDEDTFQKNILKTYLCVKDIEVKKQFPGLIKIIINGRIPLTRVASFKKDRLLQPENLESTSSSSSALLDWSFPSVDLAFLTDETGFIFGQNDRLDLPVLFLMDQDIKIGRKLNESLFNKISFILTRLAKLEIFVLQTKVMDNNLLIESQEKLVFSLDKDISRQLASLQLILQKAKIDGRIMETIDLRFDKPIIIYLPKK